MQCDRKVMRGFPKLVIASLHTSYTYCLGNQLIIPVQLLRAKFGVTSIYAHLSDVRRTVPMVICGRLSRRVEANE